MTEELGRTPLHAAHLAAGAKMVPFAGYEMPVSYSGVVDEHHAVRRAVGLFDVSHMGEVELRGPRALEVADRLVTNDVSRIADGQALYTVMCRPDGGIVDDLVVYRFSAERVFICVNASNREKDFAWMREGARGECDVVDRSAEFAQIAVQGPSAPALLERLTPAALGAVKRYWFTTGAVAGREAIIARTGYTGEDGFELYVAAEDAAAIWAALLDRGADLGVKPAGLGARDALRLEMCYPLYGNDIDETTDPLEAGLGWVVKLGKGDFTGKAALEAKKAAGPSRRLVAFEMVGRGIARHGYPVVAGGQQVGIVTSGTHGPTVDRAIGMAYVPVASATTGSALAIDIRGKPVEARVVDKPFLKR
jgi:aminomethyltransferase